MLTRMESERYYARKNAQHDTDVACAACVIVIVLLLAVGVGMYNAISYIGMVMDDAVPDIYPTYDVVPPTYNRYLKRGH